MLILPCIDLFYADLFYVDLVCVNVVCADLVNFDLFCVDTVYVDLVCVDPQLHYCIPLHTLVDFDWLMVPTSLHLAEF